MKILTNCRFASERCGNCDTLVIDGKKIFRIARAPEIADIGYRGAELLDMKGSTVIPGFIDTHAHFLHTGLHQQMVSLTECKSIEDLVSHMKDSESDALWIRGYGFDEGNFRERVRPSRFDLDKISKERPVVIFRRDYHSCVVNSFAIDMLAIPERFDSRETRNGFFRGSANDWIRQQLSRRIEVAERISGLGKASEMALSRGITTVHALEGGSLFGMEDLDFMLGYKGSVPVKLLLYPQITDIEWVISRGIPRIGGCLLLDGSFGSGTAALSSPYMGELKNYGILYFDDEFLCDFVEKAHKAGLQMSFHAIGDRAIRQIVNAYEKTLLKYPRSDHRHRIEHCELPGSEEIERIAGLGLSIAVQPVFETLWGGTDKMYAQRLGRERASRTNPFRDYYDAGILMGGGSDSDVTPMDPLLGIHGAVNHPNPEFRLTPSQALEIYTTGAARIGFMERDCGEIIEGKCADLAILSENPLSINPRDIQDIEVLMTFADGEYVYVKEDFDPRGKE